jgi:hypothetical protein
MAKVLACLAAVAFIGSANAGELQLVGPAAKVTPVRIAPAQMINGQVVIGEWQMYAEPIAGCLGSEWWDGFDPDSAGVPEDEDGCGLGSSRWFFGPSYVSLGSTNDMQGASGDEATWTDFAWYWYCSGSGTEQAVILMFTLEDMSGEDCSGFDNFYDGVAYDFGDLACNPGGYYYTNADLTGSGLFHQMPTDGDGGYQMLLRTGDGSVLATGGQPMLWGNGASRPGTSGPAQWDDDNLPDGAYDPALECYDLAVGLCPDPLGAAVGFGDGSGNCGGGPACSGDEKLKAKCGNNGKLKGTMSKGTAGETYTFTVDGGSSQDKVANANGKAVAKWNVAPGDTYDVAVSCVAGVKTANCPA